MSSHAHFWPQTRRIWRQFAQMDLMMARMGVDPLLAIRESSGSSMAQARDICLNCKLQRECLSWLDQPNDPAHDTGFCPNEEFFRRTQLPRTEGQ